MSLKVYLTLTFIVALAFFLRIYKVTEVPPSLNWDEVSIGYSAYSILKTGKDEWGRSFPVHFKAYGEYKLPLQIYASIPGIALFGNNELGVRITPVLYGTLTVLVLFFLGRVLFLSNAAGLASAFLLAISPWHLQLTRASFESSFAVFWVCLGVWFFVKGFLNQKWFIISMIPFALSVFTYNSARIFTPLFLVSLLIIFRKKFLEHKKTVLISFLVFTFLILPLVPFVLSGERSARYKLVSITDDPGLIPRINENRGRSKLPAPFSRLVHNKVTYIGYYFSRNYLAHFSPNFLFITGAPHKQHHVQNMGQLYYFQAPLLFAGLFALFYFKNPFKGVLFAWVAFAFVPVSVTNDSIPHALRTLIAVPFYQLLSGLGFIYLFNWFKRKSTFLKIVAGSVFIFALIISLTWYFYNYYVLYPKNYSRDWQYGYKEVLDFVRKNEVIYDEVVFTRHYGEPHMFTLFFLNYAPALYQTNPNLVRFETYDWVRVLRFDKYYFPDLGDKGTRYEDIVRDNPGKKLLFIGKKDDFPGSVPRLTEVNFLNGESAFDIIESK